MIRLLPKVIITICVFFQLIVGFESRRHIMHEIKGNKIGDNQPSVRGMLNLYSMIKCATNCNPWNLNNYGNYCGFGGSGYPLNDIDSCCEQHDACYDDNHNLYGCDSQVYMSSYEWSCDDGQPYCHDGYDKCGYWTCVCDKAFMECLNDAGCP